MQKIKLVDEYIWSEISCKECGANLFVKASIQDKWISGNYEYVLDLEVPVCDCKSKELKERIQELEEQLEAENDE